MSDNVMGAAVNLAATMLIGKKAGVVKQLLVGAGSGAVGGALNELVDGHSDLEHLGTAAVSGAVGGGAGTGVAQLIGKGASSNIAKKYISKAEPFLDKLKTNTATLATAKDDLSTATDKVAQATENLNKVDPADVAKRAKAQKKLTDAETQKKTAEKAVKDSQAAVDDAAKKVPKGLDALKGAQTAFPNNGIGMRLTRALGSVAAVEASEPDSDPAKPSGPGPGIPAGGVPGAVVVPPDLEWAGAAAAGDLFGTAPFVGHNG
ncbi:hypothetical protein ACFYO1_02330 [Nocardia sp. NPDC006044]|uniref:hypothetical protein n=1 Tax=Nocardia sp. NPDC006044 TaxID=3364306 RepID=UPI0036C3EADA